MNGEIPWQVSVPLGVALWVAFGLVNWSRLKVWLGWGSDRDSRD